MKAFYKCIFHIFGIDCSNLNLTEINDKLSEFSLSSLQSRIFTKLALFGFHVKLSPFSPKELRENNRESTHQYSLQASPQRYLVPNRAFSASGELTFKNFKKHLINDHSHLRNLYNRFNFFQINNFLTELCKNINIETKTFIIIFPQFKNKPNIKFWVKLKS